MFWSYQQFRVILAAIIWPIAINAADPAPQIPKTWDDAEISAHQIPLADPAGSPKYVSSDYYYRIPVRPIYKGYAVYAPGHEPPAYMDWVKEQDPVILWDDRGHAPALQTDADWIRAGEIVFDAPLGSNPNFRIEDIRNPAWYEKTRAPVARNGTIPEFQYIVRKKGVVELSFNSCAMCHTRVMPDGTVLKGAQGNFPVQRAFAFGLRANNAAAKEANDKDALLLRTRLLQKMLHGGPWLHPDPEAPMETMSLDEIAAVYEAVPPGTSTRQRGSPFQAIQVPDLIGVADRTYLDRTGLEIHRKIGDFMRYAAINQGVPAKYAGFVPADVPEFRQFPPPERFGRYSDEQLYALARYVYSLKPPANPNPFDSLAARGQRVFDREGCGTCHTPPLYTNNKLTPAAGFHVPPEHLKRYDILPVPVGTDPDLTLRTARGTGYYKVPSLRGLWCRGMFPHDGSCATLEDWFDSRRLSDDYVPTGFVGYGIQKRAVPGHQYGLKLPAEDKRALIAFLRTL